MSQGDKILKKQKNKESLQTHSHFLGFTLTALDPVANENIKYHQSPQETQWQHYKQHLSLVKSLGYFCWYYIVLNVSVGNSQMF